jgi:DNA gyrase subunit A
VIAFSTVSNDSEMQVITAAKSQSTLAGIDGGSLKRSLLTEFPAKGRATGGVRAHKFIRNEDHLYFASIAPMGALACAVDGTPIEIDSIDLGRRDASGEQLDVPIYSVGTR